MQQRLAHGLFIRDHLPAVVAGGDRCRDVILYLHGLGESGLCFEQVMIDRRLASWHQVAVDLPGYGKSPWSDQPIDFACTADRLVDWLARSQLPPVVVVGHSMGGVLGADVARRAPSHVRGFLNVEGNISFADCTFSRDAAALELADFLESGGESLIDEVYRGGVDDAALRGYYASLRMADRRQLHRDSTELVARSRAETLASESAAVAVPIRYVLGNPRGTGTRSRSLLDASGVRWIAIEDAGHWPYLDQHDAFVDVLSSFLATVLDVESNRGSNHV